MIYKTTCPKCAGSLSVVQLTWTGKMPLHKDGFSFDEANTSGTDGEIVSCDRCGEEYSLGALLQD